MDFSSDQVTTRSGRGDALRLLQMEPSIGAGLQATVDQAASLGFSGVLLASPFMTRGRGARALVADFDRLSQELGGGPADAFLSEIAATARRAGLDVLLDVVIDRIAAGSAPAASAGALFTPPEESDLLDPRRNADAAAAVAALDAPGGAAFAAWWTKRLAHWQSLGIAGFRLTGLTGLPGAHLADVLGSLRKTLPDALLLVWTPGLDRSVLPSLAGLGLDGVFSSMPWWDWQSPWLWEEAEQLQKIAPVLGMPWTSGTLREGSLVHAGLLRGLALSAGLGGGWVVEAQALSAGDPEVEAAVSRLNRLLDDSGLPLAGGHLRLLGGSGGPVLSLLRTDHADPRRAASASLLLINTDTANRRAVDASLLLAGTVGSFGPFTAVSPDDAATLAPTDTVDLPPGAFRLYTAASLVAPEATGRIADASARAAAATPRLAIENPTPCVDGGLFPLKRILGELVAVEADVICDGHDINAVALQWQSAGDAEGHWQEARMRSLGNDRWTAAFPLTALGRTIYRVLAWRDAFATYRDELAKKHNAGVDTSLEIIEGLRLVAAAASRTGGTFTALHAEIEAADEATRRERLLSAELAEAMSAADDRPFLVSTAALPIDAERTGARFSSWYEVFPRSMSDDASRHGTFADVERHLPRIEAMGFDVLYFPPVHPIGLKNRKGRNNTLTPGPDDVGSPYAIGSAEGGHDAMHPQLGSFEDFARLRSRAAEHGIELAIDFAVQCSPDHPWLREHPGWFDWRPDGSIRYAENPPKKYQDIVNVDFYAEDAIPSLWLTLAETVLFWAGHGVRLFRVDNPHTKPFPFWQWLIAEVRAQYPDAIFLAEAFTRPKVMYRLAKVGFSQSYTYFTWRNTKAELTAYFTELSTSPAREVFRPHLFVNTPDINPPFLQTSGRTGHLIRAALGATLSGLWGVYSGFELCEATPIPGREEYLDSEKYEIRAWDWQRPGNIVAEISQLNRIRRDNPALQTHLDVSFLTAANDTVLYFEKATTDRSNVLLIAVSLDPTQAQDSDIEVPLWKWRLPDNASVHVEDLVTGGQFTWTGKYQRVRLSQDQPYAIWRVRPA